MKKKKIPLRVCAGCQEQKSKKEMIRVVRTPEGAVEIDKTGKKSGRGVYICQNSACLEKATTAIKDDEMRKTLKPGAYR